MHLVVKGQLTLILITPMKMISMPFQFSNICFQYLVRFFLLIHSFKLIEISKTVG